MENRFSGYR